MIRGSSNGGNDPLPVSLVWQLSLCPDGLEDHSQHFRCKAVTINLSDESAVKVSRWVQRPSTFAPRRATPLASATISVKC